MIPYSRKKQRLKIAWTAQLFEQVNVSLSTGYLRTTILADTIWAPYLRFTTGTLYQHGQNCYPIYDREPQKPYPIPQHIPM